MPKIMQVTMVKSRVRNRLCWPMLMMERATFRAKPVRPQTPTIIPTQAQAMATETVDLAPATKASPISLRLMRLMGLSCATTMVTTMVQKALIITVLPLKISMYSRKTMGISKWPRSLNTSLTRGRRSLGMPSRWSLVARICT